MVNSESEVLPSPLRSPDFYGSDLQTDASLESDSDIEPNALRARESRPFFDGGGWKSSDHYYDVPQESSSVGWQENCTRMENISVNGAKRRQWKIHQKEIRQILTQCRVVLGLRDDDGISRGDFTNRSYGAQSPLFALF